MSMRRVRHASELAGVAARIAPIIARPASGLDQTERRGPSGLDVRLPSQRALRGGQHDADRHLRRPHERPRQRAGRRVRVHQRPVRLNHPSLLAGRYDTIIGARAVTPDRLKQFNMLVCQNTGGGIVVAGHNPKGIKGVEDLCGLKVAMINGAHVIDQLQEISNKGCTAVGKPAVKTDMYEGSADTYQAVAAHRADTTYTSMTSSATRRRTRTARRASSTSSTPTAPTGQHSPRKTCNSPRQARRRWRRSSRKAATRRP
jgi:ABC-type amino acid transport substrate-binding protein